MTNQINPFHGFDTYDKSIVDEKNKTYKTSKVATQVIDDGYHMIFEITYIHDGSLDEYDENDPQIIGIRHYEEDFALELKYAYNKVYRRDVNLLLNMTSAWEHVDNRDLKKIPLIIRTETHEHKVKDGDGIRIYNDGRIAITNTGG